MRIASGGASEAGVLPQVPSCRPALPHCALCGAERVRRRADAAEGGEWVGREWPFRERIGHRV